MFFLIAIIPLLLISSVEFASIVIRENHYIAVEKVVFSKAYQEIIKDSEEDVELAFAAQILPYEATDKAIEYRTSNPDVANVDENGNVCFVDFGEVEIYAQSVANKAIETKCKFLVTDSKPHRIEFVNAVDSINVGESFILKSNVIPQEATDKSLTYESSNESVAKVLSTGKVMALSKGSATITARTTNGIEASFDLEVIIPVTGIEIPESKKTLVTGESRVVFPQYNILPSDATNKNVRFVSENEQVATISQSGQIEFKQRGDCRFSIITLDGNFSDVFHVTYTGGYILSGEIDVGSLVINTDYQENKLIDIQVDIYPYNADRNNIIYTSLNEAVVKVNSNNTLSIVGGGRAQIKVSIRKSSGEVIDLGLSDVFVSRQCEVVSVESENIEIDYPDYELKYTCLPADHTNNITFESDSTSVATVSSAGVVLFENMGQVKITITANQNVKKVVTITYKPKDAKLVNILQDNETINCFYGESFVLSYNNGLGIDLSNVNYSIVGDSFVYDEGTKLFYARKGGESIIYVSSGATELQINVKVVRYANSIQYEYDTLQNTASKVVNFSAVVMPADATSRVVSYAVSDASVATIDSNGVLTFKKAGTVTVYMRVDSVEKTVDITSTFGTVGDFQLKDINNIIADLGESIELVASNFSYIPTDYDFDINNVIVSVQYENIANVSGRTIVGLSKGITKVYVVIDGVQKSFDVEVQVKTKSVDFVYDGAVIDGGKVLGNTINLDYVVSPSNANNKNVVFSVVDGEGSIDAQTGVVNFGSGEFITIAVTTLDSGVYKVITLYKVALPNSLSIYYGNENVTNGEYLSNSSLKVLPEQEYIILKLNLDGVLTSVDDIGLGNFNISFADQNTVVEYLGNGEFKIFNTNSNKSITDTIVFAFGDKTSNVTIKFYKLQKITLALSNDDDIYYGLERKRVFGTTSYLNGTEVNYLPIEYTLSESGKEDELFWFVTAVDKGFLGYLAPEMNYDLDFFTIEKDPITGEYRIVSNLTNQHTFFTALDYALSNSLIQGIELELRIKVVVGNEADINMCTVTDEYIYTFVPAVNVYDSDGYNANVEQNKVLQTNFVASASEAPDGNYTLFQPLMVDHESGRVARPITGDYRYNFAFILYGNGYLINFNGITEIPTGNFLAVYRNMTNVHLKLQSDGELKNYNKHLATYNAIINYSIIENMTNIYCGDDSIYAAYYNCVIRNANKYGISISSSSKFDNFALYIKNCVFYNVSQCAINAQNGKIYISGFFDVYNFVSYNSFPEYSSVIKSLMESAEYRDYVYYQDGMPYVCAAIAGPPTSFSTTSTPKVNEVYFMDPTTGTYVSNIDTCTGQNYNKLTKTMSFGFSIFKFNLTANLWVPKKSDRITPTSSVDLSVVYRKI